MSYRPTLWLSEPSCRDHATLSAKKTWNSAMNGWTKAACVGGIILASGSWGCLLNDDCDAKPIPIEGSESDYTLAAGQVGAINLHTPMKCPKTTGFNQGGDARFIVLESKGVNTFGLYGDAGCQDDDAGVGCGSVNWDQFAGDVVAQVRNAHPSVRWLVPLRFGNQCEPDPPISACQYNLRMFNIQTNDWRIMNTLVGTLRQSMEQEGIGECVGILVSEIEVACPN